MKKFLIIFIVAILVVFIGCKFTMPNSDKLPKSLKIYQSLKLTDEQKMKVEDLQQKQLEKIKLLTQKLNVQKELLMTDTKLSAAKQQENLEKYLKTANEVKDEITDLKAVFDDDFLNILDEKQQKTYKKYINQREKEKIQREKKLIKEME